MHTLKAVLLPYKVPTSYPQQNCRAQFLALGHFNTWAREVGTEPATDRSEVTR